MTVKCELFNQRQELVFTLDKVMLFPQATPSSSHVKPPETPPLALESKLLSNIIKGVASKAKVTKPFSYQANTGSHLKLHLNQLLFHQMSRPIGHSASFGLSTCI